MNKSEGYMLCVSEIEKSFSSGDRSIPVLADVSLRVSHGEVIGLVGPSGIGKTTVLNIIAGELSFDSGEIVWEDSGVPEGRFTGVRAAMIFQDDAVFPWMRVVENVAFSRVVRSRARRREALREAAQFLSELGLARYGRYWPRELSGGMRKRVELARAVFSGPRIMLLDEPFSMLDTITRSEVHTWFLQRMKDRRMSAILVTHDLREAIAVSDRVLVLNGRPASIRLEVPGARSIAMDGLEVDRLASSIEKAMT